MNTPTPPIPRIRRLVRIDTAPLPVIRSGGRELLCLCSNNYLGLAADPRLTEAAKAAVDRFGAGSGASRFVCGDLAVHEELEEALARFEGRESCVLFGSGYQANVGTLQALAGPGDAVIADRLDHASIIDGCRLSRARLFVYPHRDCERLERILARTGQYRTRVVVTDSIFSMDGDRAPLREIAALCSRHGALLMVDEAHATGLFGENGRGLCEETGVEDDVAVRLGTLSKALGSGGGFITGEKKLLDRIRNTARSFIYTTAPVPASCGAALEAVRILGAEGPALRKEFWGKIAGFRRLLETAGIPLPGVESQILPLRCGTDEQATALARGLEAEGLWAPAILPPTVPAGTSRLRLTPIRTHTTGQLETCARLLVRHRDVFAAAARAAGAGETA